MALIFNQPVRVIDIRGTIKLTTGTIIDLTPTNIVSYDIVESSSSSGFALGEAQAATYTLVIDNVEHSYTAAMFNGASVQLELGIETGDGSPVPIVGQTVCGTAVCGGGSQMQYVPFGSWIIETSNLSRQSAVATLEGSDALATMFELEFADTSQYPQTVGSLFSHVCGLAGVTAVSDAFLNSAVSITKKPEWPEGTTLRGVVAYIAAVAGGFARMTRDGKLEIVSYADRGNAGSITADTYKTIETGGGAYFDFNCLGVKYMEAEEYTRYTIADGADNASNTLQIDSNPLYTESIAISVKNALNGFYADGIGIDWVGDPTLRLGDVVTAIDTDDTEYTVVVNSQTFRYDGGLGAFTESELATETSSSSGYVINEPALNAAGMLNGGKLIAGSVVTEKLAAQSVTAEKIAAGAINADKITAGAITTEKLSADEIKAFVIEAVQAKIGEIVAGKITSDELFAAILGAVKLSAETGSFTFAEVKNLLANTLFVVQGVGEKVQIANLSVTEANIVSLSVGDLLIRNENGEMVRIYVDADGNIQTGDPIADGTLSGAKIIQGSITTSQLNTDEIFANDGIVMNLIANKITSNEALIDSITTNTIGNLSGMLDLYVRRDNLETYLRLLTDGVHVGQSSKSSEVVVTPETVDVRMNGATYSQFASNYVQFGNYQIRRSADGGMVFKMKE